MRLAVTAIAGVVTVLAAGYAAYVLMNGLWDSHQPFGFIALGVAIAGAFVMQSGRRRRYGGHYGGRYNSYDDRYGRYGGRSSRGRGSAGRSGGWSSFGNSSRSGGFSSFGRSSSGRSSGGGSKSGGSSRGKSR